MEQWIQSVDHQKQFDIVIDCFAGDKAEILSHCSLVAPQGLYFWRQNHLSQISQNLTSFRRALKGASYLTDISNEVRKRRDGVRFVPAMDHKKGWSANKGGVGMECVLCRQWTIRRDGVQTKE